MGILSKPKQEHFAQLCAKGEKRGQAYVTAFGPSKGADQSACRLLKNAKISTRIAELSAQISDKLLNVSIKERNFRLEQMQARHELLRRIITERAADPSMAEVPGGSSGLICRDWRGKDAVMPVYKVDTGLLSEIRAIEEQAAREVGELQAAGTGNTAVQVNVTFVSPQ